MEKTNSKILTVSFAVGAILAGFTLSLLIKAFSGAFGIVARATDSDLVRHGLPVAVAIVLFAVLQFNPRTLLWGEEVVTEVRKIVWPTQKDTVAMTIAVIVMVLISSLIIASFDFLSGVLISSLMK